MYVHMHTHTQSLLIIFGSYNKDTANTELSNTEPFILTKENTGLGSCEPLVTIFSSPINT